MSADRAESSAQGSGAPATSVRPLYTVGYGARSIEEFVALLQEHRVECLIDVRSAPYSRFKPEFSKEPLEAMLRRHGIVYLFMGDSLGGQPSDPDCYSAGKVDYEKVRLKPLFLAGLERLRQAWIQPHQLAVMCSEGRPEECHRTKLIGQALSALGLPVQHIDEDGRLRSQEEVIDRLTGGQLDLFGPSCFTSRKRYRPGAEPTPDPGG